MLPGTGSSGFDGAFVESIEPMAILSLGISHRSASVDLLERLAFADDDLPKAYRAAGDEGAIEGAVILSTCNRVEVYAEVPAYHAGFLALKRLLTETRPVTADELGDALYSHYEDSAAEHLFDVAAGLDSMVLGEPQILSQVRGAHRRAESEDATAPALTAVFHAAARAGRRVHTETQIGAAPDALVAAGTDLAGEWLGGLDHASAAVVGAGPMAALAVKHLRERGVRPIRVLSRSPERARAIAERAGAEHGGLQDLGGALEAVDLVVSATGATALVVSEPLVRSAIVARSGRPLFLLDLAVPRDVEPSAGALEAVRLVDIAGLRDSLSRREHDMAADLERAHDIIAEEVRRFAVRRRSERLAPLITALRDRGDAVARSELERFRSELAGLRPQERAAVEALARGIVAKLLHDPIVRLKERSAPGADAAYAATLAELFGIELAGPSRP
jgi:glutamyl-tRNA reductase